jgi:hypothetical protein
MESEMNRPPEPEPPIAHEATNRGSEAFNSTKRPMSQAYDRSARALGDTYDHALAYGRQNPGKTALIAFGIGVGVGVFLLGSRRHSRVRRYGEPIVNVLSNVAREFIRTL